MTSKNFLHKKILIFPLLELCIRNGSLIALVHEQAAVYVQDVARNVAGLRGGQKSNRVGHFLFAAWTSQRDMAQHRLTLLGVEHRGHRGLDIAWRHRVYCD